MVMSTNKKAWLLNPNSRKYKQLEFVLGKMPMDKTFTTRDMINWLSYHWEYSGQVSNRDGRRRKAFDFHHQHISRFLTYRNDVETIRKDRTNANLYRRIKNVMDREI